MQTTGRCWRTPADRTGSPTMSSLAFFHSPRTGERGSSGSNSASGARSFSLSRRTQTDAETATSVGRGSCTHHRRRLRATRVTRLISPYLSPHPLLTPVARLAFREVPPGPSPVPFARRQSEPRARKPFSSHVLHDTNSAKDVSMATSESWSTMNTLGQCRAPAADVHQKRTVLRVRAPSGVSLRTADSNS